MKNKKAYFLVMLFLFVVSFLLAFIAFGTEVMGFELREIDTIKLESAKMYCVVAAVAIPMLTVVVYTVIRSVQNQSGFFQWSVLFLPIAMAICAYSFALYLLVAFGMGCFTVFLGVGSGSDSSPGPGRYCDLTSSSGCC